MRGLGRRRVSDGPRGGGPRSGTSRRSYKKKGDFPSKFPTIRFNPSRFRIIEITNKLLSCDGRKIESKSLVRFTEFAVKLYMTGCMGALLTTPRICGVEGDSGDSRAEARDVRPTHGHSAPPVHQG